MDSEALNTQALIEAVALRAGHDDPLAQLETAVTFTGLASEAADAMLDHYIAQGRAAGLSWTVIGERLGVSKQAARQRFSPRIDVTGGPATEPATLAPRLLACLEVAQAAADQDDSVPGTQHLLLGLLHAGVAANILDRVGVTRERVREASDRLFEAVSGDGDIRVIGDGDAEATVTRARRFAANRNQNVAGTEHVLFLLAVDPGSSARRVLNDLGVDPARIKKELNECIPQPPRPGRRGRKLGRGSRQSGGCSFCGCADPHRPMVHGPGVTICGECVAIATDIIEANRDQTARDLHPGRRRIIG